jgi:hypothetical protein
MISFLLVGCVDYQSPLDVLHHQTRFAYMVVKPGTLFGPVMGAFKPTGKIDGLVPMQNSFGGGVSVD